MELLALAVLGVLLLVIDQYTRSEWVRVAGMTLIIVATILFLSLITTGGSGIIK